MDSATAHSAETPILQLLVPYEGRRKQPWSAMAFSVAAGLSLVIADTTLWQAAAWLLPLIAIHEFGHALAAKCVGFEITAIKIGPIRIAHKSSDRVTTSDFTGFVVAHPDKVRRLRRRYFWFVAGGPLANIAGIGLLAMWAALQPSYRSWSLAGVVVSAYIALVSLWPVRTDYLSNDGAHLIDTLRGRALWRRRLFLLALYAGFERGLAVAKSNKRWIRGAAHIHGPGRDHMAAQSWMYSISSDAEDLASGACALEQVLSMTRSGNSRVKDFFALEAAIFLGWHERDSEKLRRWRERVKAYSKQSKLQQLRFEIVSHCCTGAFDKALESWESGLKLISTYPKVQQSGIRESWLKWKGQMEERRRSTVEAVAAVGK